MEEATKDKDIDVREVTELIRESVRESILEASALDLEVAAQSTAA